MMIICSLRIVNVARIVNFRARSHLGLIMNLLQLHRGMARKIYTDLIIGIVWLLEEECKVPQPSMSYNVRKRRVPEIFIHKHRWKKGSLGVRIIHHWEMNGNLRKRLEGKVKKVYQILRFYLSRKWQKWRFSKVNSLFIEIMKKWMIQS